MRKLYLLFFALLFSVNVQSQAPLTDTLEIARQLTYQKKFPEANAILTRYNLSSANHYGYQIQAQVLYWMKDFEKAENIYLEGIKLFPEAQDLKLDYGRMLFQLGKYKEATEKLTELNKNSDNVEIDLMLAKMSFWNGRLVSARNLVHQVLSVYPTNPEAKDLLLQINQATPLSIGISSAYTADDQPLINHKNQIQASWFKSYLISPSITFHNSNFSIPDKPYKTSLVNLENSISLGYGKTALKAGLGLFKSADITRLLASLQWTQKLSKNFSLNTSFAQNPYQYTLASIKEPVFETVFSSAINYNHQDKWLGSAGYLLQAFEDGNKNYTAYAWGLAPIFLKKNFSFRAGISASFASSTLNTFTSPDPVNIAVKRYPAYTALPGIYTPYFTPRNQQINALLTSLKVNLSKKITFSSRSSVGVLAKADNPYLMLEQNRNHYIITRNFYEQTYMPVELEGNFKFVLNTKISVSALYRYSSLFFYKNNFGQLQLNYRFIHE